MEEIKRLIEARLRESLRKQLPTKLMCIAKYLGQKIYTAPGYGSGMSDSYFDSSDWLLDEDTSNKIPEMDDVYYTSIGYIYDSLHIGKNIEIRYLESEKELLVTYNGKPVYQEIENKLKCYVPSDTWESTIDSLYEHAKEKEIKFKNQDRENKRESANKRAYSMLQQLRDIWGF